MNETSTRRAGVVQRGLATISGCYFGLIAVFGVLLLLLPDEKPPGSGCDGIGWGCTPNPRDGLLIVGLVAGLPALVVSLLVTLGTFALIVRRFRSGVAAGATAFLAGLVVVAAVPVVIGLA